MNITFLGTAAATSYPLVFCTCTYCKTARELGGKNLRKRSSLLINDDLLIDLGPDTVSACFSYGKSLSDVRYLLQTHPHSDHFDPSHFVTRIPEYMGVTPPLSVIASQKTLERMSQMVAKEGYVSGILEASDQKKLNITVHPVAPLETISCGSYTVTAFPANHDESVQALLYAISDGTSTVFYGTDTDSLPQETWKGFAEVHMQFDSVILDHTYGWDADSGDHLNANRFIEVIKQMKSQNLLTNNAQIYATHISHEGNAPHEELCGFAQPHGYEIAYDGLRLTI